MLQLLQVETALLFGILSYFVTSFIYGKSAQGISKSPGLTKLYITLAVVIGLGAIKLFYDYDQGLPMNYYRVMEVARNQNVLDIRRSYKTLSRKYHPDKNSSPDAEIVFNNIKIAYDVLIDETMRDIYNRFGPLSLDFDPRKDEIKLMIDIATGFFFWGLYTYLITVPVAWRGGRSWIAILALLTLAAEVTFSMSEVEIPLSFLPTLTEYELMFYLHSIFPILVIVLGVISHHFYVDVDETSIDVLNHVISHQQAMSEMLGKVEYLLENAKTANPAGQQQATDECKEHIAELRDKIEEETSALTRNILALKKSTTSLAADYHWIVLVLVYGLIFYLGSS